MNVKLEEEVYVTLSLGFKEKGVKDKVYKLEQDLYNLWQVLRASYGRINNYIWIQSFQKNNKDSNVYFTIHNRKHTIILFYKSGIIIIGDDTIDIQKFKEKLINTFEMIDLRDTRLYLRI